MKSSEPEQCVTIILCIFKGCVGVFSAVCLDAQSCTRTWGKHFEVVTKGKRSTQDRQGSRGPSRPIPMSPVTLQEASGPPLPQNLSYAMFPPPHPSPVDKPRFAIVDPSLSSIHLCVAFSLELYSYFLLALIISRLKSLLWIERALLAYLEPSPASFVSGWFPLSLQTLHALLPPHN